MASLGKDGILNYRVSGVGGTGAWNPITLARDVTINGTTELADATSRASGGWKQQVATIRDLEVDTEIIWDSSNAAFGVLRDAWLNSTVIGIQALDGTGGEGPEFDAYVADFTRNEPINGVMTATVKLVAAPSATAPDWLDGDSGTSSGA